MPGCADKSGNRGINVRTGLTSCFRCGKGDNIWNLARGLGIELELAKPDATPEHVAEELDRLAKGIGIVRTPVYFSKVDLPEGFKLIADDPECYYATRIERMAKRKNLEWEDMVEAGVGFTRRGSWEPFAIFPVKEWDTVTYYQGRTYNDPDPEEGGSTKKFPSRHTVPHGSRHWVYNIDEVRATRAKKVIVVESILNVLSLRRELRIRKIEGVVPVAIFKSKISYEQAVKLAGLKWVEEMCLMFDEDATQKAWDSILPLTSKGQKKASALLDPSMFTIVEMPVGCDANDDAILAVNRWHKRASAAGTAGYIDRLDSALRSLR